MNTVPGESVTFIVGAGLNNPDTNLFSREETGETLGEDEEPIYRLALRQGEMRYLGATTQAGTSRGDDPDNVSFYEISAGRYLRVVKPRIYGFSCSVVEDLPELDGEWGEVQGGERGSRQPARTREPRPGARDED